jgi:hypothetical protein
MWYVVYYTAFELILIGLLIDIRFSPTIVPLYTIGFTILFLVVEWIKPRLLVRKQLQ